ncbi:preprotein translocase subunit SecG [Patescibacteria group bacterium]|nr:preprotein translocase subunit SecG [Patescibacteria group bacterium]MBU4016355.1 preprotein translocase subunit SecG [Patescibacteria group bacterium]MBU4099490.1 preprotein translocase subunit SecG [Patescibacteria group bacterium]
MLENILNISQLIISIFLIGAILLQTPEGGLSPVFGGGGEMYRSRRNVEKLLLIATIVLSIILGILSLVLLFPQFNK